MAMKRKYRTRPTLADTSPKLQELEVQKKTIEDKILRA